jgi:hypothetical protein
MYLVDRLTRLGPCPNRSYSVSITKTQRGALQPIKVPPPAEVPPAALAAAMLTRCFLSGFPSGTQDSSAGAETVAVAVAGTGVEAGAEAEAEVGTVA